MSKEQPLVSIYIPTFNRLNLLQRAIESILGQSYSKLEVIIVDDFSTDGTGDYCTMLSSEDSRFIYLKNEDNRGSCYSRNRAIEAASGRFITGLDDDDCFFPTRIEEFVNYWPNRHPETVALASYYQYALPGKVIADPPGKTLLSLRDLYLRNLVGSQVFAETHLIRKVGGFDTRLAVWQDYDLWLGLLQQGYIERVASHSYLVDRSHDFERISNSQYEKVKRSSELITSKHQITGSDALRFKSQRLVYKWEPIQAVKYLLLFSLRLDIAGLKAVVMRTIRAWKQQPH